MCVLLRNIKGSNKGGCSPDTLSFGTDRHSGSNVAVYPLGKVNETPIAPEVAPT